MEDKIREIIKKEFNAETLEIKRITEGFSHHVYLIKLNREPKEAIIRFSNNKDDLFGLEKEKWVIEKLAEKNIPVPKILAFDSSKEGYLIIEKFEGERLDALWPTLSKEDKVKVAKEMGKLLEKIHSTILEKFGKIKAKGGIESDEGFKFRKAGEDISFNTALGETNIFFMKDFGRLLAYNTVSKELMKKCMNYIIDNMSSLEYKGQPKLIHGDFHTGHLFVEKQGKEYKIIGLIDFEFAASFPPEYDFLKLHRQGFFDDEELFNALQSGYGSKIDKKAVELYRLERDLGFIQVMLDCGNKEQAEKTLKTIKENIK